MTYTEKVVSDRRVPIWYGPVKENLVNAHWNNFINTCLRLVQNQVFQYSHVYVEQFTNYVNKILIFTSAGVAEGKKSWWGNSFNTFSKISGAALCYKPTKKWWDRCSQAQPIQTPQFTSCFRFKIVQTLWRIKFRLAKHLEMKKNPEIFL